MREKFIPDAPLSVPAFDDDQAPEEQDNDGNVTSGEVSSYLFI